MAVTSLTLSLANLLSLASGARISVRSQVDSNSGGKMQIGPEGEDWATNTKYVCMQKWQNPSLFSSEGSFVDKYCLAKYEEVESITPEHVQIAKDIATCDASKDGSMKVCALKGKAPERRLSFSTKTPISKACFRMSDVFKPYDVIEAALDETQCEEAAKAPVDSQVILPALTTTTTTTTTITTTTTTIEEEPVDDNLVDPTEVIEIKGLFSSESMRWEYKGMLLKCCTSSVGKPTQLQDMNAESLPSERSFGTTTGCGRMFGDTYHDGLSGHDGAEPSCPVLAQQLMDLTGEDYAAVKSSIR